MIGSRTTHQRTALGALLDEVEEFRSAHEIHALLAARGVAIGLATVYRALAAMVDAGDVDTVRSTGSGLLYRRCTGPPHHHHLICRRCGRVVEIIGPDLEAWLRTTAREHGFTGVEHTLDLVGLCARCAAVDDGSNRTNRT